MKIKQSRLRTIAFHLRGLRDQTLASVLDDAIEIINSLQNEGVNVVDDLERDKNIDFRVKAIMQNFDNAILALRNK